MADSPNILIVSPKATLRKGERVVVKATDGKVEAKSMQRKTANAVELASFNTTHKAKKVDMKNGDWMARIIWATH